MKKTVILILIISLISTSLTGCFAEDRSQEAIEEFSQYFDGTNDTALFVGSHAYLQDIHYNFEDITYLVMAPGKSILYNGNILSIHPYEDKEGRTFMRLYEFSLNDENLNLINSIYLGKGAGNALTLSYTTYADCFYFKYRKEKTWYIGRYCVSTNKYSIVYTGKENYLVWEYVDDVTENRYEVEVIEANHKDNNPGAFIITDTKTNEKKVVDDEYLKKTVFIDSMEKFNYYVKKCFISGNHILLTYNICGFPWDFPNLVFEYDFETDKLEYEMFVISYDNEGYRIVHDVSDWNESD